MPVLELWHGSPEPLEEISDKITRAQGFHAGTREQAEMRAAQHLYMVRFNIMYAKRCKDNGEPWSKRIADARRRGYCAIVYLNRYEGLSARRVFELSDKGLLPNLDRISDSAFQMHVPEARDSYIILHATDVVILEHIDREHRKRELQSNPIEGDIHPE